MFLCCGDALFDLFVDADDEEPGAVGRIVLRGAAGGSPMNVAFGLSRLGHDSRFFTPLSQDVFGRRLMAFLGENGVDTSLCPETEANTTLAIVELDPDGAARYAFYTNGTADTGFGTSSLPVNLPEAVSVLHFGSYSTAMAPAADALLALAQRETSRRFVSYDVNVRLPVVPDIDRWRQMFAGFAARANLVKASDEDIETLFGEQGEDRFVTAALDAGADLVCITRGAEGGRAFDREGRVAEAKAEPVSVVDTVGAGDTFQATLLHWLAREGHIGAAGTLEGRVDLEACLALAAHAAAITCSRRGADLPTREELAHD